MNAASRRGTLALRRAGSRYVKPSPTPAPVIRAIQQGTTTLQGPLVGGKVHRLCVRYSNGSPILADYGRIDTGLRIVWGRLIEGDRND
jgi:hypothetical protein